MLFFSNNTNNATENETAENQSTGKAGILKNIAIIAGTAAGIGGVIFGAKKLHDHLTQDYLEDFEDDFDDSLEDENDDQNRNTDNINEAPVEDFKEVETEETKNEATSEEKSEEEITEDKETVEEKSKTEETVNPLLAPFQEEKPESQNTSRLKEIKATFETFKLDLSVDDVMSVLKKLDKIDEDSMIDLRYISRDKNLTEGERKLVDEILGNFLTEIAKVIEISEMILNGSEVTAARAERLYEFLNTLRWNINSIATREVKDRIIEARDLALQISKGEAKIYDTSSNETEVKDATTTGETQTVADDDQVIDDSMDIVETLDDSNGQKVSDDDIVKCIEKLEVICKKYPNRKSMENLSKATIDAIKMARTSVGRGVNHYKRNIMLQMDELVFVKELKELSDSLTKVLSAIDAADGVSKRTTVSTNRSDMKIFKIRIDKRIKNLTDPKPAGENQTAENCFDAFKPEHKETNKVEGETKTSTEPLTYTMEEKVAEAVKTGDEIQAPVAATEECDPYDPETRESIDATNDIQRIIGSIGNRTEPWKNDMRFIVRCLGNSVSKVKIELLSKYQAEDLGNSVIVLMRMLEMCFEHEDAFINKVQSVLAAEARCHDLYNEFIASGLVNLVEKKYYDTKLKSLTKAYGDALSRLQQKRASLETAVTQEPEEPAGLPVDITSEMDELEVKLKEAGNLIKAGKWSDAKEFYKSQLTPYLVDENLSADLREQISAISTKATNMLAGQKQMERKKEAEAKKSGNRKSGKKARRNKR